MEKKLKRIFSAITKAAEDDSRTLVVTITTSTPDRSGDIVMPKGGDLDNFRKNPVVLYAHNYAGLPIAKCIDLQVNDDNIVAKVQFPEKGIYELADIVYEYYKAGILSAWSIGFMGMESVSLDADNPWGPQRFEKWELLEFSSVPVPANPEALTQLRTLGFTDEKISKGLEEAKKLEIVEEKGVIAYKETPKADENEAWDGPAEVKAATVDDLKIMCAWVDSENADNKGAYKLPHHKADGEHVVVLRGVEAAMGALLGARGGVDIPEGDRKGVYNHLAKHYKQFEKDAPEFKAYTEEELKALFPEVKDNSDDDNMDDMLVSEMKVGQLRDLIMYCVNGGGSDSNDDEGQKAIAKSGRVISSKNESLLRAALKNIETVLATLEQAPDDNDGDEGKAVTIETLKKIQRELKQTDRATGLTLRAIKNAIEVSRGGEK